MTRILILIKGLGPGGAERLLVNAAPFLNRSRFDYEVAYVLPDEEELRPELEAVGMAVHRLGGSRGGGWIAGVRALAARGAFDLVHAHSPLVAAGARVALRRSLPFVYTEHDVWPSYRAATSAANMLSYPRNDHVFAVSERVRASIRYPWPLRSRRMPPVETLYHGASASVAEPDREELRSELRVAGDRPVIGTVANYRPEKGHGNLLAAATIVRDAVPEARFVLVGRGPLEEEVRREASERGLNGTVVFAGPRHDTGIAAAFEVFVLASLHEGLPIALLEAMSVGRPVVVTDAGGIPEVVSHDDHGLVVPAGDPRALADGIVALLRDPALRDRLGDAARRRSRDFDIRRAVERMEEVYGELTE